MNLLRSSLLTFLFHHCYFSEMDYIIYLSTHDSEWSQDMQLAYMLFTKPYCKPNHFSIYFGVCPNHGYVQHC